MGISGRSGTGMVLAEAISSSPNNPSCPVIRSRCSLAAASRAGSMMASIWLRRRPNPLRAPLLIRASTTRLFTLERSTRRVKSKKSLKGPRFSRSSRITETAASPTLLMAPRPNRMVCPSTEKPASLVLMSGGSTLISISRQTPMYQLTLSATVMMLFRKAAMYSTG